MYRLRRQTAGHRCREQGSNQHCGIFNADFTVHYCRTCAKKSRHASFLDFTNLETDFFHNFGNFCTYYSDCLFFCMH